MRTLFTSNCKLLLHTDCTVSLVLSNGGEERRCHVILLHSPSYSSSPCRSRQSDKSDYRLPETNTYQRFMNLTFISPLAARLGSGFLFKSATYEFVCATQLWPKWKSKRNKNLYQSYKVWSFVVRWLRSLKKLVFRAVGA